MNNDHSNNKRIAKNTLFLYVRMLFLMVISLYTSRVILNALGVIDYGIYNVVGGVVAMFSIVSGSLSAAISRFITFEMGKEKENRLHLIFCTAVNIQLIMIVVIVILLETIGLWFLNHKMVIPADKLIAANWLFQFSVVTFAINLLSVPYTASIVAHEKMSAFAYISIFDGIAKLGIAFVIMMTDSNRLILYGILVLAVGVLQRFLYGGYCVRHFEECHYKPVYSRDITKEMFGFAGWNFIGASSVVLRDQGGNILINLFFGPAVNAARGIAMSVNSAVYGFVSNFMVALNPQITKSYASGELDYMEKLTFQGARLSFYILLILALPILITMPYLLKLWLGIVPDYTTSFARLVLIFTMSESLASPLITVMLATGKIRDYQIIVGGLQLMNLPLCYLAYKYGAPPECIYIVAIIISVICEIARLVMLNRMIGFSIMPFLKKVYANVIIVSIASSIMPIVLLHIFSCEEFSSFVILCCTSILSAAQSIYYIGCTKADKALLKSYFSRIVYKICFK